MYIPLILSIYSLLISKKELKAKGITVSHLFLSFYVIIFSRSDWGVRKDMKGFLGHLYFSECHYFLSALETSLGSTQSQLEYTSLCLLSISLNSHTSWVPQNSVLMGHHECHMCRKENKLFHSCSIVSSDLTSKTQDQR